MIQDVIMTQISLSGLLDTSEESIYIGGGPDGDNGMTLFSYD